MVCGKRAIQTIIPFQHVCHNKAFGVRPNTHQVRLTRSAFSGVVVLVGWARQAWWVFGPTPNALLWRSCWNGTVIVLTITICASCQNWYTKYLYCSRPSLGYQNTLPKYASCDTFSACKLIQWNLMMSDNNLVPRIFKFPLNHHWISIGRVNEFIRNAFAFQTRLKLAEESKCLWTQLKRFK